MWITRALRPVLVANILWGGIFAATFVQAKESPAERDLVEVEVNPLTYAAVSEEYSLPPYRERREHSSTLVEIRRQYYLPKTLVLGSGNFESVFALTPITSLELEVSRKWNFRLLSLGLGISLSRGAVANETSSMQLGIAQAGMHIYFDALMGEPYLVPYFGVHVGYGSIKTSVSGTVSEYTMNPLVGYVAGVLLQLNMFSSDTAVIAYHQHHLENTYLEAGIRTTMLGDTGEIEFASEQQTYIGLTLEL